MASDPLKSFDRRLTARTRINIYGNPIVWRLHIFGMAWQSEAPLACAKFFVDRPTSCTQSCYWIATFKHSAGSAKGLYQCRDWTETHSRFTNLSMETQFTLNMPKLPCPMTIEELLYEKYYSTIHDYLDRIREEARTEQATDLCVTRAHWLTSSTSWARIFSPGPQKGLASCPANADVLYFTVEQLQERIDRGANSRGSSKITAFISGTGHFASVLLKILERSEINVFQT